MKRKKHDISSTVSYMIWYILFRNCFQVTKSDLLIFVTVSTQIDEKIEDFSKIWFFITVLIS